MSWKARTVHASVQKPDDPTSTMLQVSMKRHQRSCATLRASRLLIDLSRISITRRRTLLEQQANENGTPGEQSPHERDAERWTQSADRLIYSATSSSGGI